MCIYIILYICIYICTYVSAQTCIEFHITKTSSYGYIYICMPTPLKDPPFSVV